MAFISIMLSYPTAMDKENAARSLVHYYPCLADDDGGYVSASYKTTHKFPI